MTVIKYPDDRLRQKSTAVEQVDAEIREFAKQMYQSMLDAGGIGISAPQVGRNIRLIGIICDDKPLLMANPVVIKSSLEKRKDLEGCLSFPDKLVEISRPVEIHVKFRNMANKMEYKVLKGIEARAVQHEIDHINAKLLSDYE